MEWFFLGFLLGVGNQNQNQNQGGSYEADLGIFSIIIVVCILIGALIYWIREDVIPWISNTLIPWLSNILTFGNIVMFGFLVFGIFTLIFCVKMIKKGDA